MLRSWLQSAILALILAIFATTFALVNAQIISVNLVFGQIPQISLALVILISVLIGVIFTGIVSVVEQIRLGKRIKELEKKVKEYEPIYKG
ncbi:MAG: LapA family protein [Candidatus Saganbacteria bacterium]|nr:LapA family protein [Candidatus Saganbacteria bacterium]